MRIRHAEISDLDTVSKLESEGFPPSEADTKEVIKDRLNKFSDCFWLLDDYGEIYAFIAGMATDEHDLNDEMFKHSEMYNPDGDWLIILSVVTGKNQRHKGYASDIMNQVIADTKAQNRKGIVLTCKEELLPFYSKFGFVNEGISQSNLGGVKWYQMRLDL